MFINKIEKLNISSAVNGNKRRLDFIDRALISLGACEIDLDDAVVPIKRVRRGTECNLFNKCKDLNETNNVLTAKINALCQFLNVEIIEVPTIDSHLEVRVKQGVKQSKGK